MGYRRVCRSLVKTCIAVLYYSQMIVSNRSMPKHAHMIVRIPDTIYNKHVILIGSKH